MSGTRRLSAFAAGAKAHLTGELAVCAGSCGLGNLNFLNQSLYGYSPSRATIIIEDESEPSNSLLDSEPEMKRYLRASFLSQPFG